MFDKIKGIIIGCALGDALGAPHEFTYQNVKYSGKLEHKIILKTGSYYNRIIKKSVVGQFTDDTEMMLILVDEIINGYRTKKVIKSYIDWVSHGWFMGRNTRALFKGIKTVNGYRKRKNKILQKPINEWTQSNGALMRCAILSLIDEKYVIKDCKITNPHPVCIDTNILYTRLIRKYLNPNIKFKEYTYCPEVLNIIKQVDSGIKKNIKGFDKGWCLHGLYCALYCDKYFDNYKDALDYIIKLGGDTDTNGAIVGALLGAKYGFQHIYQYNKENCDILLNADSNLGELPSIYHLKNIDDKCHKLMKKIT